MVALALAGSNVGLPVAVLRRSGHLSTGSKCHTSQLPTKESESTTEASVTTISRTAGAFLIAASFAALSVGSAQNFQVDKWDIGGDGGTD